MKRGHTSRPIIEDLVSLIAGTEGAEAEAEDEDLDISTKNQTER
jgi:hypothetical protein